MEENTIENLPNLQSERGNKKKVLPPSVKKTELAKIQPVKVPAEQAIVPEKAKKAEKVKDKPPVKTKSLAKSIDRVNLDFMTDVDAAIYRKGHPFAFMLSLSGVAFFIIFLVWANFAEIDQVTRGTAQIISSQRTQEIQNLEGGILEEILVQDGQIVQKGEILATINNQSAESFYKDKEAQYYESMGAIAQLKAFLDNTAPVYPDELKEKAPNVIVHQNRIFKTSQEKFKSEILVLENQYNQRVQEKKEIENTIKRAKQSLTLAKEQRAIATPLLNKGIYSRVDYIGLEQRVVDLEGEISGATISLSRLSSSIEEAKQRIELRRSEIRTTALADLSTQETAFVTAREALATGVDRVDRLEIKSPIQATVKRILIRTTGGVIKPGETIMELVPLDDTLLVEARINPQDRGFIHPGQKAIIKISSFDYAVYGGVEATVEQISADTLEDKRGEFYYQVTLRTKSNIIKGRGETHPIIPGMTATVDILTGQRTVLDYILKPILKAKNNALSER